MNTVRTPAQANRPSVAVDRFIHATMPFAINILKVLFQVAAHANIFNKNDNDGLFFIIITGSLHVRARHDTRHSRCSIATFI